MPTAGSPPARLSRQRREESGERFRGWNCKGDPFGSERQRCSEEPSQERSGCARAAGLRRIKVHGGSRKTGLTGQQQEWPPASSQQPHFQPDSLPRLRGRREQPFPEFLRCARHGCEAPQRCLVRSAMEPRMARLMSAATLSGGWVDRQPARCGDRGQVQEMLSAPTPGLRAQKDIGDILYDRKEMNGAFASYRAALAADPAIKGIYKRYGEIAMSRGLPDEEVTVFPLRQARRGGRADVREARVAVRKEIVVFQGDPDVPEGAFVRFEKSPALTCPLHHAK